MSRTAELHPGRRLSVWFQDEARFGQQGTTTRIWADCGRRATAVRQVEFEWVYLFGSVCPASGRAHGCLLPYVDTTAMNAYLADFSRNLSPEEHALLVLDRAGWHRSRSLAIPANVTLLYLPPYSPELNPIELAWSTLKHWLRESRARTHAALDEAMAQYFDLVLALFPFEVPFFEKYGLKAAFVGHPVIERSKRMTGGAALRARLGIAPDAPLLAMLPGSRTSEIRLMVPTFRKTVALLAQKIPGLVTVLPTVPHVAAKVRAATENWPTPLHIIENEADKFAAFDAADVAFAASGTVTAEIALSRTPMVVFYILGGLTYALGIWLFNSRFFTLLNVLLDREAAPEFLQARAKPEVMAAELEKLFHDPAARAAQIEAMNEVGRRLGEGEEPPSQRAARVLLDFIK